MNSHGFVSMRLKQMFLLVQPG